MRQLSVERSRNLVPAGNVSQRAGFPEPYRKDVEALASHSPFLNDLAHSFPGLLFALATGYGSLRSRKTAYSLIKSGAPLKHAARALQIPWWMKKLPPRAYGSLLSGELPDSPLFSKHIINFVPKQLHNLSSWLTKIIRASQLCNEQFALWVANTPSLYIKSDEVSECDASLELLAAWAWYSTQKNLPSHYLIQNLWHPNIGLHKALDAAKNWYNRTKLILFLGDRGIEDCWLEGRHVQGYDIVPLRTADDFLTEAGMMRNCLDQYADQIRFQRVRVFSMRRNGIPVANIEIGPHEDDRSIPNIEQVRGPKNNRVSPQTWQVAYAWLGQQNLSARPNGPYWPQIKINLTQHPLWVPYYNMIEAKQINASNLSIFNLDQTERLLMQLEGLALLDSA